MTHVRVERRTACRLCGGTQLQSILALPQMPLTDDFVSGDRRGTEFLLDLAVYICVGCGGVQTQHDVDTADYYRNYQYAVGGSPTAQRFMSLLAGNLMQNQFTGIEAARVLEVGSGDGGQLIEFKRRGAKILGVEPSEHLCRVAEEAGVPSLCGLFTADTVHQIPKALLPLDAIVLSYTFDHLPDPSGFLRSARGLLHPDRGRLVIEIHDLERIFDRIEFCLFEHEHTIYLTEASASELCAREGFAIVDFDLVPIADRRANSLIFVAAPSTATAAASPATPRTPPTLRRPDFCRERGLQIETGIERLDRWIRTRIDNGRKVAGYGAGGRGVMTMAAMRHGQSFRYLADRKPKHPGALTPKSGVPVVPISRLAEDRVDDVLVFSYGYMNEIRADLAPMGYRPEQLTSMLDVLSGRVQ